MTGKKFNPFSVAIVATEKAIKEREKKITAQQQIEKLSLDLEYRAKLLFDIGYAEGKCEFHQGQKKKAADLNSYPFCYIVYKEHRLNLS